MTGKKWLLLDHDGTLFNTEPVALPSLIARFNMLHADALKAAGKAPLDMETFLKNFHGQAREKLCANLSAFYGFPVDTAELYLGREASIGAYYATVVGGIPMAPNLLPALRAARDAGWGMAVVTNNPVVRSIAAMRHADDRALGAELFGLMGPNFWEAGDVQKPDPDVYLRAMAALGTQAADAVAIEDSVTGVKSAVAAGIRTLGYTGFGAKPDELKAKQLEAGCVASFGDYAELPALLAGM